MVALGLTGVVWQSVTQRIREFGLRRAKGATIADVRRQVLVEMVIMTSLALIVGVALLGQLPLLPLPSDLRIVAGAGVRGQPGVLGRGDLPSDARVRLVSEPAGDEDRAGRGATLRVSRPAWAGRMADGRWHNSGRAAGAGCSRTALLSAPSHDSHRRRRPVGDGFAGAAAQAGRAATVAAGSPDETLEVLRREPCQLVIQDMNFSRRTSGEEGLALLKQIKELTPAVPVILITAWGSIALAVEGMKAGASDFVTKPWTNQQLLQTVQTALGLVEARADQGDRALTRDDLDARYDFGDLVGRDARMLRILSSSAGSHRPTPPS